MNEFLTFGLTVILISGSGVISPGPLLAANVMQGIRGGTIAGIKVATGHTIIELPLIFSLAGGIIILDSFSNMKFLIYALGGLGLFIFAGLQINSVLRQNKDQIPKLKHGAFLAGIVFTGLNPFFILWWLTIGMKLISDALSLWSTIGLIVLFGFHIWMDYVWLGSTAYFSKKSTKAVSGRAINALILGLSLVLIYFGVDMIIKLSNMI